MRLLRNKAAHEIAVDRSDVYSNPNGLVYGVHENSSDFITVLDPNKNSFTQPILSGARGPNPKANPTPSPPSDSYTAIR